MQLPYIGCALFVVLAFITDIRTMKIPNKVTISFFLSGLLYQLIAGGWSGVVYGLKGSLLGFGILFLLYCFRTVGGGDVKLFGGIGVWTGMSFTLSSLVYSIVIAGIIGFFILLIRREVFRRISLALRSILGAVIIRSLLPIRHVEGEMLHFPFMLAVLPGCILAYLYI
ncbi:prepilin peptidase [Paenibacillus sp. CAA11]|uniref:A24 family peptidase n=1 Tax=Paenibacillus sp. CAA11 TaxID=1532905 RepID=UPI000D3D850F|nr:prepilin peptidase [Paenibacillus sp. CAA11]AWB43839.1 prepilin peptidase [Paenibacillus sp. CAA11]